MRRHLTFAALLVAAVPSCAQIAVDSWTADNGLPQNILSAVCQTPDGYIWLATFDGLVRFDGVRFTTFSRSNTPGINGNRFGSLLCAPNGDIWAGAEGSGVTRRHAGVFTTYGAREGLVSANVDGLTGDEQGNVWALAGNIVHQWMESEKRFAAPPGEENRYRGLLSNDGRTGFVKIAGGTLRLFLRGRRQSYPLPPGWPIDDLTTARAFEDQILLIHSTGVTAQLIDGRWSSVFRPRVPASAAGIDTGFLSRYRDSHGNVWTFQVRWDASPVVRYLKLPSGSDPAGIAFKSLFEDREGNLWLCTDGRGLFRLRRQTIEVFSAEQGLPDRNVYPIYQTRDHAIWMGTWSGGLCRWKDGKTRVFTTADGLASNRVYALLEDRDGVLWVSVEHGLHRVRGDRVEDVTGHGIGPDNLYIRAIHQDKSGTMWFGMASGLFRWDGRRWTTLTRSDGLAADDARVIIDGRDGLWVGGYGGLSRIRNGRVESWTEKDGLGSNMVRALHEDRDEVLWIGTYDGGLSRFENGQFTRVGVRDGLFNEGVFQILEDGHDNLWMSSNRGIYRVNRSQLNDFAARRRTSVTSIPYGKRDGMRNIECNGGLWPAGIRAVDGKLWFPTQDGAAIIDPDQMAGQRQPPPVVIESCLVDRSPIAIGSLVRMLPRHESLEIQYTALSFLDAERIQFRFRLAGLDRDWVNAGTRRTAYYSHVPPGSYTFQVAAANSDGLWTEASAGLAVLVLPPFYRTWWFALLLSTSAALSVGVAWRLRLAKVERARAAQQEFSRQLIASQESERKRIAAELHDSLGQRLAVIRNLALLALDKGGQADDLRQRMDEISSESSLAMAEVREISYNLRPYHLDRLGLRNSILALVRNASKATPAKLSADVDEIDEFLPLEARINFYRIVQESLNNVLKHSQATSIDVSIERRGESMLLEVRDNGRGFTLGAPASDPLRGGAGLLGIRQRAEMLGGTATVQTAPGQGTLISVLIESGGNGNGR
jgi:signal transduction histidine kinase